MAAEDAVQDLETEFAAYTAKPPCKCRARNLSDEHQSFVMRQVARAEAEGRPPEWRRMAYFLTEKGADVGEKALRDHFRYHAR